MWSSPLLVLVAELLLLGLLLLLLLRAVAVGRFQAATLLLFNESPELSFAEVQEKLNLQVGVGGGREELGVGGLVGEAWIRLGWVCRWEHWSPPCTHTQLPKQFPRPRCLTLSSQQWL